MNMGIIKAFKFIPVKLIIFSSLLMEYCAGIKRKLDENVAKYASDTGQPIAIEELLKIYEVEHYKFHNEEANINKILEWPHLEQKNLNEYCLMYIHHVCPTMQIDGVTGTDIGVRILRYENATIENSATEKNSIIAIKCERWNRSNRYYYMTRAPEHECIYALRGNKGRRIFVIINKHCGFERNDPNVKIITYGKEIVEQSHEWTGQPIAKEKYIREFEQEHQELFKKEAIDEYLLWPYIMEKKNLDEYCSQYLKICNPRKTGDIQGIFTTEKLQYQNYTGGNATYSQILAIKCVVLRKSKRIYYITRAPQNNCVYALIRVGPKCPIRTSPVEIIFKHCDFEDLEEKKELDIPEGIALPEPQVSINYEIKQKKLNTLEIVSVPPANEIKMESSDS